MYEATEKITSPGRVLFYDAERDAMIRHIDHDPRPEKQHLVVRVRKATFLMRCFRREKLKFLRQAAQLNT